MPTATPVKACCGSLGYAMVDADNAKQVVMLTEELLPYPHNPASIEQDQVDLIVKVDRVGDAAKNRRWRDPYDH